MKLEWKTALGFKEVVSGEIAPHLSPIELRFYPFTGFEFDGWDFSFGIYDGFSHVKRFEKEDFVHDGSYFKLNILFSEFKQTFGLVLNAIRKSNGEIHQIFKGMISPNDLGIVEPPMSGLFKGTWDISSSLNMDLKTDYRLFELPKFKVQIPNHLLLLGVARSKQDHNVSNAPIVFKDFHKDQKIDLEVLGGVIGFGGMGGDAGYSRSFDGTDITYGTDGLDGGNPIYIEYPDTQVVNVFVDKNTGMWEAGGGGGSSSPYFIRNKQSKLQIGLPGVGGYPTGLIGNVPDIYSQLELNLKSTSANVVTGTNKDGLFTYIFKPSEIETPSFSLDVFNFSIGGWFTSNDRSSDGGYVPSEIPDGVIQPTKGGKPGNRTPQGVVLKDTGKRKRNSIVAYGLNDENLFNPLSKRYLKE